MYKAPLLSSTYSSEPTAWGDAKCVHCGCSLAVNTSKGLSDLKEKQAVGSIVYKRARSVTYELDFPACLPAVNRKKPQACGDFPERIDGRVGFAVQSWLSMALLTPERSESLSRLRRF